MVENKKITFGTMFMTEMYCENSQENEFLKMIEQTESFMFTSKGEMILLLKYDSGSVIFK
jgi:heat shock protein HslJ